MISLRATIANGLWKMLCTPARRRMAEAIKAPRHAQQAVLSRILQRHADCAYAKLHHLTRDADYATFKELAPIVHYDELAPWIERMKQGERNMLCQGELIAFEKSSGSTAAAKWIPFNLDLRNEFQEAIRAWMGDLFQRHPNLAGGRAYWVVSPLTHAEKRTAGGIAVGLANDDEYLGCWERKMSSWLRVANSMDLETTAKQLLAAKDLRLISVWNPSYLALLYENLNSPKDLWPNLELISCWADGHAAADADRIKQLFPHVTFQPKGLLATEGVVTIPWGDDSLSALPALHSHFLEFQDCITRDIYRVHELSDGSEYEVIITTSGGLWRYRLGDVVKVVGFAEQTPRLRFIRRADGVSDLRGEKLHPIFVQDILAELTDHFAMLAPHYSNDRPGYALFTTDQHIDAISLENKLSQNPYYAHAIAVGQLDPVKIFDIADESPASIYLQRCASLGQRPSTAKASDLHRMSDWDQWFRGKWRA